VAAQPRRFLRPGQDLLGDLSRQVPGRPGRQRAGRASQPGDGRQVLGGSQQGRRRRTSGPPLSGALRLPRRHQQPPLGQLRTRARRPGARHLQLSQERQSPLARHDRHGRRVHPAVPPARAAQRLPEGPALRLLPFAAEGSTSSGLDGLAASGLAEQASQAMGDKSWVVHSKAVGDGHRALRYLAPYVYRVAISNRRLVNCEPGPDGPGARHLQLSQERQSPLARHDRHGRRVHPAVRALQHVLPSGFQKVRHYGFCHSRQKDRPRVGSAN
jgi:hypothetical protein